MPTPTSTVQTNTVEIYDLTSPGSAWIQTILPFPFFISGSRGVTLDNIFYVTGRQCQFQYLHDVCCLRSRRPVWHLELESRLDKLGSCSPTL